MSLLVLSIAPGCYLSHALDPRFEADGGPTPADAASADVHLPVVVPGEVRLRAPANGVATGSVHVPFGAVVDHPLAPFLSWEPVPGAREYHVQMDGDCPIRGFRECAFESPEVDARTPGTAAPSGDALGYRPEQPLPVSMSAPVGRRYVWRVRACAIECGPWSDPRYLDVGRQRNDLNGDGFADLVVGAHSDSLDGQPVGAVYVFEGSPGGLTRAPLVIPSPVPHPHGRFGLSLDTGDLDADGYADLLVGADVNGQVFVFRGGSELGDVPDTVLESTLGRPVHSFGYAVSATGDRNGDGFGDFAVHAHAQGEEGLLGMVLLYQGEEGAISILPSGVLVSPEHTRFAAFGNTLAAGDFDGDGFMDLATGASEIRDGVVYVHAGGPEDVATEPTLVIENPAPTPRDHFGFRMTFGDLDGDGFADLIASDEQHSITPDGLEGRLYVFRGGPWSTRLARAIDNPRGGREARFAGAMGVSDLDRDGIDDLLVGAYFQDGANRREGTAFLYRGSRSSVADLPDHTWSCPEGCEPDAFFGVSVLAVDTRGDGLADVAIGAHGWGSPAYAGSVFLYDDPARDAHAPPVMLSATPRRESAFFGTLAH